MGYRNNHSGERRGLHNNEKKLKTSGFLKLKLKLSPASWTWSSRGGRRLWRFWSFLGDFFGTMEDGEIRTWNVTLLLGVPFFGNLALRNRKSALWRLGLDALDSPSSLTLFGSLTSPGLLFLAAQPLTLSAPSTLRHRSGERPKTKDQDGHWFSRFIPSPVSSRNFSFSIENGNRRDSCAW
jgi:hypothetical protein